MLHFYFLLCLTKYFLLFLLIELLCNETSLLAVVPLIILLNRLLNLTFHTGPGSSFEYNTCFINDHVLVKIECNILTLYLFYLPYEVLYVWLHHFSQSCVLSSSLIYFTLMRNWWKSSYQHDLLFYCGCIIQENSMICQFYIFIIFLYNILYLQSYSWPIGKG